MLEWGRMVPPKFSLLCEMGGGEQVKVGEITPKFPPQNIPAIGHITRRKTKKQIYKDEF